MSVIGTGIAAGVANTTQSARQATQNKSAEQSQRANNAKSTDQITLTQLHGAGEARDADQDLPDQQAPGYEDLYGAGDGEHAEADAQSSETPPSGDTIDLIHQADAPVCSPTGLPLGPTYGPRPASHRAPLFSRLDVTG